MRDEKWGEASPQIRELYTHIYTPPSTPPTHTHRSLLSLAKKGRGRLGGGRWELQGQRKEKEGKEQGRGCSPLGVRKCLGESEEGAPGNPFLQPHKGPGPNYTSLSFPSLPSATPINLKLEAWLLQSLSWGWQERSQTGKLRYRGACFQVQQLSGERRKAFPSPASP